MSEKDPIKIEVGPLAGPGAPVRVGKRLPGVSVGQAHSMLLGGEVPEEVAQRAAEGSERHHPDLVGHVPNIAALESPRGAWGVFCMRCSHEARSYIYPCLIDPDDWPPQVLVAYLPDSEDRLEVTPE